MGQGRTKMQIAALLLLFLYLNSIPRAVQGKNLFASLDFARASLISFRNSSGIKPSASSNGFFKALGEVERAVAQHSSAIGRPNYSAAKLNELATRIKNATAGRNVGFGRALLGEALYLLEQEQLAAPGGRKKRSTGPHLSNFLNTIGKKDFDLLMDIDSTATLIFVIDDTGSMSNDIHAAKDMAKEIITYNHKNNKNVDYILSPFNDPEPSPGRAIFKDSSKRTEFVQEIDKLSPHGGGDCPELTYEGMYNALFNSGEVPYPGSAMYVFTDAGPKVDPSGVPADPDLFALAGIRINFFLTGTCGNIDPFKEITKKSGGQIFHLRDSSELRKLTPLIKSDLDTETSSYFYKSNSISPSGRKKRSAPSKHRISVDDSMEHLTISITAANPGVIRLLNPSGADVTSGKVSLSKATVYHITNPQAGTWILDVPPSAGQYEFRVKSSSSTNIDFGYYFLFSAPRSRQKDIPITQPVSGKRTQLVLTIAGAEKIDPSSLRLEFVTEDGKVLLGAGLTPKGSGGAHYIGTIVTPSTPFRLKLTGLTKKSNKFERFSSEVIQPKTGVMRTYRATNDFTLGVGRATHDSVIMQIYNAGPTDWFTFSAKGSLGYPIHWLRRTTRVSQNFFGFAVLRLRATKPADIGKTETLFVTAKSRNGLVLTHTVQLLVVDERSRAGSTPGWFTVF